MVAQFEMRTIFAITKEKMHGMNYDLENFLHERATDDPHVRWKDPECWKCLSDEQRDVIHQWYIEELIEDRDKKKRENQETSSQNAGAIILGLSPFAFLHAMKFDSPFWYFLLEAVITLILLSVVFAIGASAYMEARKRQDYPMGKVQFLFFHTLALGISFFAVYCLLSLIA